MTANRPNGPRVSGIHVDVEVYKRCQAEAESRDVSVTWFISKLITEGLERLASATEWKLTK